MGDREKRRKVLYFLTAVYNAIGERGKISKVENYAKALGLNPNYATILRKRRILAKVNDEFAYVWSADQVPDYKMAAKLVETMSDYTNGVRTFRPIGYSLNKKQAETSKTIPIINPISTAVSTVPSTPVSTPAPILSTPSPATVTRKSAPAHIADLHKICKINGISFDVLETIEGYEKVNNIKKLIEEIR